MTRARLSVVALALALGACAQMSAAPEQAAPETGPAAVSSAPPTGPLVPLAWLDGCWRGAVNKREFREHWLPLRGDLLLGVSHTVMEGKTQDYSYLRIQPRADGSIWYVIVSPGQPELAFKLVATETDPENGDVTWTFDNPNPGYPQHVRYRRGREGWLYAEVDGTLNGSEHKVIYPMRRVGCESGELIRK